jgi:hydroxyethylthiazole kinase
VEGNLEDFSEKAAFNLAAVRDQNPLIHNITNLVAMNYTANALLAMGAAPVMAHDQGEVEDMVALAGALVINIGTLTEDWLTAMIKAGKKASEKDIPIILDPVGSGATPLRTKAARKIIAETHVRVIRGNASEILSLKHTDSKTRGVESVHSVEEAAQAAEVLAEELKTTLAITGAVDMITDGNRVIRVSNGHPLMRYVTGAGCTATVTIAAFLAVDADPLSAAATALAFFGLAGEIAAETSSAPGSFMIRMLDALYLITPEELKKRCRIQEKISR